MKIVTLGEMLVKLTAEKNKDIESSELFSKSFGGCEANVAISLAHFGDDAAYVTKLAENALGFSCKKLLDDHGVDTSSIIFGGDRIGLYFSDNGAALQSANMFYDRKYSSVSLSRADEYDFDKIFSGAEWFHFTGITAALSESCADLCIKAAKFAKSKGITVSYDPNFRPKLTSVEQAADFAEKVLPYVDVLITNVYHASSLLGTDKSAKTAMKQLCDKYGLELVAFTSRGEMKNKKKTIQGLIYNGKEYFSSVGYMFEMIEPVGGGDAFAAGLIHSIANSNPLDYAASFAAACTMLKHRTPGDFNTANVGQIESMMNLYGGKK